MKRAAWVGPVLLTALGLLQMFGDVAGLDAVKGLGAGSGASPAPKVFSAVGGLETYSTRFFIEWEDLDRSARTLELTPEVYARLRGPYNRRNVYGAAIAYGPVLDADPRTRDLFRSVARRAICEDAPLLRELGVVTPVREGSVRVRLEPRPGTDLGDLRRILPSPCEVGDAGKNVP